MNTMLLMLSHGRVAHMILLVRIYIFKCQWVGELGHLCEAAALIAMFSHQTPASLGAHDAQVTDWTNGLRRALPDEATYRNGHENFLKEFKKLSDAGLCLPVQCEFNK